MLSFCRTCSRPTFDNTSASLHLENLCMFQLMVCLPELSLRSLPDVKLCKDCATILDIIYNFKIKCKEADMVNKQYFNGNDCLTIKQENSLNDRFRACRICLVDVEDDQFNFLIEERFCNRKLMFCVPEMELRTIPRVTLCEDCHLVLDTFCKIKMKCRNAGKNVTKHLKSYRIVDFKDLSILNIPFIKNEMHYKEDFTIKQEEIDFVKEEEIMENLYEPVPNVKVHIGTHTGEKPFKCSRCEYSTARKSNLNQHKQVHTGEKPFKCSQCEYSTARKADFNHHKQLHAGEKPFKCLQCEYSTVRKSNLNKHNRVHTGEKPFKCSQCEYSTTRKDILFRHKLVHTTEKSFKCSQCEYNTARKYYLKEHQHIHAAEKPFKCSQCEYSTARKSNLNQHKHVHARKKPLKRSQY